MGESTRFGRYDLLEPIAKGGMAEVFKARAREDVGFERIVAVKRILPHLAQDSQFVSMFVDEAKIAVQLNHASIAQIYDLGCVDEHYYIALEYVHGRDLRGLTQSEEARQGAVPIEVACFIVTKVAEALDFAHRAVGRDGQPLNVIHRDVSPQNVIVSFDGDVKVIDFGLAKAAGRSTHTQAGVLKGKLAYLSPEQAHGEGIDWRSDIYALGILLFELLTGQRLFLRDNDIDTVMAVRSGEVPDPRTIAGDINAHLAAIVLKALARDRAERYQRAQELGEDLEGYLYSVGKPFSRRKLANYMIDLFPDAFLDEDQVEELLGVEIIEDDEVFEGDEILQADELQLDDEVETSSLDQVVRQSAPGSSGGLAPPPPVAVAPPGHLPDRQSAVPGAMPDHQGGDDRTALYPVNAQAIARPPSRAPEPVAALHSDPPVAPVAPVHPDPPVPPIAEPSYLLAPEDDDTTLSSVPAPAPDFAAGRGSPVPSPPRMPRELVVGVPRPPHIATIEARLEEEQDLVTRQGLTPIAMPPPELTTRAVALDYDGAVGEEFDAEGDLTSETERPDAPGADFLGEARVDPSEGSADGAEPGGPVDDHTVVARTARDTIPAPALDEAVGTAEAALAAAVQSFGDFGFDDEEEGTQITAWGDDVTRPIDTGSADAPLPKKTKK